jgi:hypothetical protein
LPVKTAELGVNLWMKPIRTCDGSGPNYYKHNEIFDSKCQGWVTWRGVAIRMWGDGGYKKSSSRKTCWQFFQWSVFLSAGWMGDSSARHHGITGREMGVANQNTGISGSVTSWEAVSPFLFCNCRCVQSVLHQVHFWSIKALDSTSITTVCVCMQVYSVTVSCEIVIKLALAASWV